MVVPFRAISGVALISVALAAQLGAPADEQVESTYEKGEIAAETLGACRLKDEAILCWRPTGKVDDDLSKQVDQALRAAPQPLAFKYGRTNRYLLRTLSRQGNPQSYVSWVDPSNGYSSQAIDLDRSSFNLGNSSTERTLQFVPMVVQPGQSRLSAYLSVTERSTLRPVNLASTSGATATLEGNDVKVVSITRGDRNRDGGAYGFGGVPATRYWSIVLSATAITPAPSGSGRTVLTFTLVNKEGVPLTRVDSKGKGLTEQEANREIGQSRFSRGVPPQYGYISPYTLTVDTANPYPWNVPFDPTKARIQIGLQHQRTIEFRGVPVDPTSD